MLTDVTHDSADAETGDTLSRVAPLSQLDDYEVADGYPEIRGWDVRDATGRSIGYVYDLLADVATLRVRYMDVELDPEVAAGSADSRVLIPLERVDLDGGGEGVLLRGVEAADVYSLVPYARRGVARETVLAAPSASIAADAPPLAADAADSEVDRERHYDDERLFARSADVGLADDRIGSPPAEELRPIAPRDAHPADVAVRTAVDATRVQERVPVLREDVEIERRPLRPGEEIASADVQGDEIRIPILAEEIVVEKRLVTREVLVIRKRTITEERVVEADLRTERVEIDDPAGRVRELGASDRVGDR
jgi:uncharacterized protein (TIGR02271 family)